METKGSQRRFTMEEEGLALHRRLNGSEVILHDAELDAYMLYHRNDTYAGAVVVIDGIGYEFITECDRDYGKVLTRKQQVA